MNGRRGFTLFEVLIALGVFAIAATGLALALQAVVDGALAARQRMAARDVSALAHAERSAGAEEPAKLARRISRLTRLARAMRAQQAQLRLPGIG